MRRIIFLLFLAGLLACSPLRIYRDNPEVLAWESDIQKFEELDRTNTYPGDAILFTGSSSIRMWNSIEEDMAPYPVIQRGFGGSKLSDFVVYTERIVYPHKSSAIVIFIANDIHGGETDKSPREVLRLFRYVTNIIRKEFHETPVIWIANTPTTSRWAVWPQIRQANKLIKDYCDKNDGLHYISTEGHFLNEEGNPRDELFLSDLLHLNEDGYRIWAGIIKPELDRILTTE